MSSSSSQSTTTTKHKHPISTANSTSPFGSLTPDQFYAQHQITHTSKHIPSTHDPQLNLFTQSWTPQDQETPIKGVVCVVHGYTGESSWFVQLTAVHIAKHGFAVCAIDHMGHGFSDGLVAHIPDVNLVVDDCVSYFDSFRGCYDSELPAFLYSESLGGAIALLITLRKGSDDGRIAPRKAYDGVVLNGAMCGISQKFKPPWPLEHFLALAAWLVPTWCVVPTRGSIPDVSFKVDWKRKLALASPRRPVLRPRAATAQELMRICRELQNMFHEVNVPFLIVHGGDDIVCDPACAEELYNRASSKDKTLKIYPGMWHQLVGEPDENVELVFGEIIDWLVTRAERAAVSS